MLFEIGIVYSSTVGSGDWHLNTLLSQLQATIESHPADADLKPADFYGKKYYFISSQHASFRGRDSLHFTPLQLLFRLKLF